MIRLVLTDMDNTLIPFGEPSVTERDVAAIHAATAAGVRFGPATGRDEQELNRFFLGDESCYATGVISNGKKVKVDGELIDVHYIDNAALERLAQRFLDVPGTFVVAYPAKTDLSNPTYVIGATTDEMAAYERRFKFNGTMAGHVPDEPLIAATIACAGTPADMERTRTVARGLAPEFDYVSPVPNWFDILPHGVDKASALGVLLGALGIGADEVAFFGDGENDLAIMERVPNSVAVANAVPKVAEAARWHIGTCWSRAVAGALEDIAAAATAGEMPAFMR